MVFVSDSDRPSRALLPIGRSIVIVAVLALELLALVATGKSTSPLLPLVMLPPLLVGALTWCSAPEAWLWFGGTFVVIAIAVAIEMTQAPVPIPTDALALTTSASVLLGYAGARLLRRRLEDATARAHAANVEAIAAVGALHAHQLATAASFAHELKNPLAAMQGLATLVRRRATREPELADELEALVADVHAMGVAVSELLDFSRAIHPESLKRVALHDLLRAQCDDLGVTLAGSDMPDDLTLVAEPRKLARVLREVVRFARVAPLTVTGRVEGDRVRLDFTHVGQASDAVAAELALAVALAAQQGGTLTITNTPGFTATLRMPRHEVST